MTAPPGPKGTRPGGQPLRIAAAAVALAAAAALAWYLGSPLFIRTTASEEHVYLSKDAGGRYVEGNTLYLGSLRATNGSFNYVLPADLRLSEYRSVIVWCRAFSVLFTWADLR